MPIQAQNGRRVQGLTDTDGTVHLVAENLSAQTALPVLLHEIFHSEVQKLLGDKRWQNLLDRLGQNYDAALRRAQEGRPGDSRYDRFWDGALRRVQDAGASKAHAVEEVAAYAIENYATAPPGVRSTVETLVGAVKAWVYQHSGVQMGAITPAQLIGLTQAALRASKEDRARTSSGNDGVRYSKAPKKPRPQRDVESEPQIPVHLLNTAAENKVYYAASAADGVRLKNQLLALAIAGGHAFEKHVLGVGNPQGSEFAGLGIRTRAQFANHVENVINSPSRTNPLDSDREHFYDSTTNTIVIRNQKDPDGGTSFRPEDKENYAIALEERNGRPQRTVRK